MPRPAAWWRKARTRGARRNSCTGSLIGKRDLERIIPFQRFVLYVKDALSLPPKQRLECEEVEIDCRTVQVGIGADEVRSGSSTGRAGVDDGDRECLSSLRILDFDLFAAEGCWLSCVLFYVPVIGRDIVFAGGPLYALTI